VWLESTKVGPARHACISQSLRVQHWLLSFPFSFSLSYPACLSSNPYNRKCLLYGTEPEHSPPPQMARDHNTSPPPVPRARRVQVRL
jgi:hypothetical protein